MNGIGVAITPPVGWLLEPPSTDGHVARLRYVPEAKAGIVRAVATLRVMALLEGGLDAARRDIEADEPPAGVDRHITLTRARTGDVLHVVEIDARPTQEGIPLRIRCRSLQVRPGRAAVPILEVVIEDPVLVPGLRDAAEALLDAVEIREEAA